ncbi:MAG: hypothetical protein L6R38_008582, partial [Xanthoria sp. 2 TBL-2021]
MSEVIHPDVGDVSELLSTSRCVSEREVEALLAWKRTDDTVAEHGSILLDNPGELIIKGPDAKLGSISPENDREQPSLSPGSGTAVPANSATKGFLSVPQDCRTTARFFHQSGDAQHATHDNTSHGLASPHDVRRTNTNPTSHGQQTAMTPNVSLQLYLFLFHLTALATALSPREPAATPQTSPTPQSWEIVKSGRYNILGCSDRDSYTLKHLLSSLHTFIQPAIDDADRAITNPSPAFTTFFHSPLIAANQVSKLLTDISTGRSAYPPSSAYMRGEEEDGFGTNPLKSGNPTFVCISEPGKNFGSGGDDPDLDGYDLCKGNPALVMDHFRGTQYIN